MRERPAMVGSHAVRSRPAGATMCKWWKEQLGGASEDAQSYWQGRFAACAFVERVWHTGRPRNSWGVAPNPTRGAASGLSKGQTERDEVAPMAPIGLTSLSYSFRVLRFGGLAAITPQALPLPPPHPSPDSAGTARLPPDAGRDASSRYYRPAPHGLPSPPSRLPSPRGSRFPSRRPCR